MNNLVELLSVPGFENSRVVRFYYLNVPHFYRTNLTLRLALAPLYLDSELGIQHAIGPQTDHDWHKHEGAPQRRRNRTDASVWRGIYIRADTDRLFLQWQ